MKLKCTFSQAQSLFNAGGIYEHQVNKRCGMMFNEVKANNGFLITLQPGETENYLSAFSGNKLLADFQVVSDD